MPTPWVVYQAAILLTSAPGVLTQGQVPVRQTYGDLVVEAKTGSFTRETVTFRDGVKATFGQEVLTADSLTLYPQEKRGRAEGHVLLVDPDGTLSAEDLSFSWNPGGKAAAGRNVRLDMAGVLIEAATARSIAGDPPTLIFTDVQGTSCGNERTPLYQIHSPRVTFTPGKEGVIRKPTLYLFGHRIATLPTHHFSLDPRVRGIPLPGLAIRQNGDLGIGWTPSFLLGPQTAFSGNVRAFPGEHFTADAYVTRSYLSAQRATSLIMPRSDLSERFSGDYFNNVRVQTPQRADQALRSERQTLSVGTSWNRASLNDTNSDTYSKLLEGVYEVGGPMGNLGYQTTLRVQQIRREDEPFKTRLVGQGTVGRATLPLGGKLFGEARLDAATFLGTTAFGWVRAEAGAYTSPTPWATVGVGYAHGTEFGDSMYPMDRLLIRDLGTVRADFDLGPTQISYLLKRDFDRDKWYREYAVTQVMGCLEAFVISRQFPRSYQFGVRLRIDEFLERLRSRKLEREPGAAPAQGARHVHS